MNEDINESGSDQGALSVREAARKLLAAMDREGEAVLEGTDAYAAALSVQNEAEKALRQALQRERSNMPAIPGAETAREGVELIKAGGQISPDHIRAIVQAAEWAFEAVGAFELRWDADMRAIKRWRAAGEGRDMIWPDHYDLVLWLLELVEDRPACPSINDVAALIGDLRKFAASVLMQRAADQLEQMANALVASSRRTVQAESDRAAIPGLIVAWLRSHEERPTSLLHVFARHFADAIEAGEWLPLRGAAIRAERAARPRLQLVEGGCSAIGFCENCGANLAEGVAVAKVELIGKAGGYCPDCYAPNYGGPREKRQRGPIANSIEVSHREPDLGSACEESIVGDAGRGSMEESHAGDHPARIYDSLRVVFGRPDVQEAIAKAVAAQRGADWQEATEAGRNAFREEAAGLLRVALAQPS